MSEPQQAGTEGEPPVARLAEQRWPNRNIIRANGVDWDQPRSIDMNAGCGFDAIAAGMRQRVQTYADIAPAFLDREVPGAAAVPGHDHPGWFHLPPAHRGGPSVPGMHTFKELFVAPHRDRRMAVGKSRSTGGRPRADGHC